MAERPTRFGFWKLAYEEHAPAVLRFLSRRADSREDAEDLLHETFLRAINADGQLRDPDKVRSYLFTTATNLLRNHHRRGGPRLLPLDDDREDGSGGSEAVESLVFLRALVERLEALVEGMSPAHRTAFQLGLVERLPYREIAGRTGWSLAQVKVNVHRARRRAISGLGEVVPEATRRHFDGRV